MKIYQFYRVWLYLYLVVSVFSFDGFAFPDSEKASDSAFIKQSLSCESQCNGKFSHSSYPTVPGVQKWTFESNILKRKISFLVYLPPNYEVTSESYPSIYLLHGRGESAEAWTTSMGDLHEQIVLGLAAPVIAIAPDFSINGGAGYYVDSNYKPSKVKNDTKTLQGERLEEFFIKEFITYIESHFRIINERTARGIVGYSMGGFGAIRYSLKYPELFSLAIIFSPAIYQDLPPLSSSMREFGAFGFMDNLFSEYVYKKLNYPKLLVPFTKKNQNLKWFVVVGNSEPPLEIEARHLKERVQYIPQLQSSFLFVPEGEHNWSYWRKYFLKAIHQYLPLLQSNNTQ